MLQNTRGLQHRGCLGFVSNRHGRTWSSRINPASRGQLQRLSVPGDVEPPGEVRGGVTKERNTREMDPSGDSGALSSNLPIEDSIKGCFSLGKWALQVRKGGGGHLAFQQRRASEVACLYGDVIPSVEGRRVYTI